MDPVNARQEAGGGGHAASGAGRQHPWWQRCDASSGGSGSGDRSSSGAGAAATPQPWQQHRPSKPPQMTLSMPKASVRPTKSAVDGLVVACGLHKRLQAGVHLSLGRGGHVGKPADLSIGRVVRWRLAACAAAGRSQRGEQSRLSGVAVAEGGWHKAVAPHSSLLPPPTIEYAPALRPNCAPSKLGAHAPAPSFKSLPPRLPPQARTQ